MQMVKGCDEGLDDATYIGPHHYSYLGSCLVKHGSQSNASSIPVCGQTECCFAPCPSQLFLLQSEHPRPPEAFAATLLSLPQRPTAHSAELRDAQPCLVSDMLCFHGLTKRYFCFRAKSRAKRCHRSLCMLSGKQGACFACTDCTEAVVACAYLLDSHSWNRMQLLRRFEAPASPWLSPFPQPDQTGQTMHRNTNTAGYRSGACLASCSSNTEI